MTEEQWLSGDDPTPMLKFLRGKASERKLLLFACTCLRSMRGIPTEGIEPQSWTWPSLWEIVRAIRDGW
jgi:hypothetical protein